MPVQKGWKIVPDDKIINVWSSDCDDDCESHGDEAHVNPNYYADNGEPSCCSCGKVYSYTHTEIKS